MVRSITATDDLIEYCIGGSGYSLTDEACEKYYQVYQLEKLFGIPKRVIKYHLRKNRFKTAIKCVSDKDTVWLVEKAEAHAIKKKAVL